MVGRRAATLTRKQWKEMGTESSAGAVVYRKTAEGGILFLLLQSAHGKPWGFPKGKLDAGENEVQAARREIAEESGLTDIELDLSFRFTIYYNYRSGHATIKKTVTYFIARSHTDTVRISWEHVAYRWASYEEAIELVVYENARNTLKQAHEHLRQKT